MIGHLFSNNPDAMSRPLAILDMDLTIIGDISLFLEINAYYINTFGKWFFTKEQFIKMLAKGVLRPGFKQFIQEISQKAIIAVYTLSNRLWADFVVDCIEEHIGFKFATIILAREDTANMKKSVKLVLEALNKKGIDIDTSTVGILDDNPKYYLEYNKSNEYKFFIAKPYNYLEISCLDSEYVDEKSIQCMQLAHEGFNKCILNKIKEFLVLAETEVDLESLDYYVDRIRIKNSMILAEDRMFSTMLKTPSVAR
jgi:hypothetical protein